MIVDSSLAPNHTLLTETVIRDKEKKSPEQR